MMKPVFWGLLLVLLPLKGLADGKVFSHRTAFAEATIPDQRALLCWSNGTERLVIETRFSGDGTNFAWVVPLPSRPIIEEATTGLFPTLAFQLRSRVVHEYDPLAPVLTFCLGVIYLLLFVRPNTRRSSVDIMAALLVGGTLATVFWLVGVLAFLFLVWGVGRVRKGGESRWAMLAILVVVVLLSGMLLPSLAKGGRALVAEGVVELERQRVGSFETSTLTATNSSALIEWLRSNHFQVSAAAEPVIADYVQRGWVFVVSRLHRDGATLSTNAIHPLSFTFAARNPVYPLRLTRVGNGRLGVELYVFGPERAEVDHFRAERCATATFPTDSSGYPRGIASVPIMHPLLRKWTDGAAVVTRLTASLSPAQMERDAEIRWQPFAVQQQVLYSRKGAASTAADWATGLMLGAAVVAGFGLAITRAKERTIKSTVSALGCLGIAVFGLVYLSLPKARVVSSKYPQVYARVAGKELGVLVEETWAQARPDSLSEAKAALREAEILLTKEGRPRTNNLLLGGAIHEEDSPGNYQVRQTNDGFELVWFDFNAAEEVVARSPGRH